MNNIDVNYKSAHAIVISNYGRYQDGQPKQYVLLGLTENGELSTFGGARDNFENDPKQTAAREVYEESIGLLGSPRDLLNKLKNCPISSGYNSGHITYVIPGEYYGDDISGRFKRIRFDKNRKLSHDQKEMIDIVPIRVDDIKNKILRNEKLIFPDNDGKMRSFRWQSEGAIKKAVRNKNL